MAARQLLAQHAVPWDGELAVPNTQDFERRLRRASSSAPGPDGLGCEAWRAGGTPAAETLSGMLAAGGDVPHDFNEARLDVLPKGVQSDDVGPRVTREAAATRLLALRNADAKSIAGAMAWAVRAVALSIGALRVMDALYAYNMWWRGERTRLIVTFVLAAGAVLRAMHTAVTQARSGMVRWYAGGSLRCFAVCRSCHGWPR